MIVNLYKNYKKTTIIELEQTLSAIKDGRFSKEIAKVRELVNQNNNEAADSLKRQLLAFTPCGTFGESRTANDLQTYNQLIVLDYDNIPAETYNQIFYNIIAEPTTYCAFKSPSGNGIKALVLVDSLIADHQEAFLQVKKHYEEIAGHSIDSSGKDVSRLCYVSYDGDLYLNEEPIIFNVEISAKEMDVAFAERAYTVTSTGNRESIDDRFKAVVDFTNNMHQYIDGNRNNYVYQLACNANRKGIFYQDTLMQILNSPFGYDVKEVTSTVKSAYRNESEFGSAAKWDVEENATNCNIAEIATLQEPQEALSIEELPFIPDGIYPELPNLLKKGCSYFKDLRQRDIFLTGALGVLSGCMRSIYGRYHTTILYPNLYVFVTAPAGSGKGALTHTRNFGVKYHQELTSLSVEQKAKSLLFIPGNASAAALTSHLQENNGQGIFFETEADTLSNTFKQEWGNFSDLLRKAFHHEDVSYTRKGNNEHIEINKPKLSVVLSGTPGQIQGLIKSSEDGLFSRFLFYAFKASNIWENVKPSDVANIYDFTDELSDTAYLITRTLNQYEAIGFKLKDDQWDELNHICTDCLREVTTEYGDGAGSLVKRMGVMWFRLAMILTALRNYDEIEESKGLTCSDTDFETAKNLILTYKEHILYVYNTLPKNSVGDEKATRLYNILPYGEISLKDCIPLAAKVGIGRRDTSNVLDQLVRQKAMIKVKRGIYARI